MTSKRQIEYLFAKDLRIGYKQKNRETCVAKISELAICPGDFICLLGPNGAGKSTLIRTLAGLQAPLEGTIHLKDQTYDCLSPRERARRLSVVLTEALPLGMLDAYSLVALGRHPYSGRMGILQQKDKDRIDWAFRAVDAKGLEDCQISQLSDGERQKLSIARALAQETPLMLLDEPTAFLDLPRRVELMATLRKLTHQEQLGALLSTHDLDLALRFADRIWLLDTSGTIVQGYPEELVVNGEIGRTFSGKEVEWNIEQGTFRIRSHPHLKATVCGDSACALWTRRALERFGFDVTTEPERCVLKILLSETPQHKEWLVEHNGSKHRHASIGHFIKWLHNQDWSTGFENS